MNNFIIIITLLGTGLGLEAQIPKDFNFLNHSQRNLEIFDLEIINDNIISINRNGANVIKYDYQIESGGGTCAENQKLIYVNDSTYHLANWYFNCSDGIINGLWTQTSINGEISYQYYDGFIISEPSVKHAHDITHDTTGGWWCFTREALELLYLENGAILDTVEIYNDLRAKLFTSCNGDIYVHQRNELLHFSGDTLEYYNDLPVVREFFQDGQYNYILDGIHLYKYDCTLSNVLHEWTLPFLVNSFNQLNFVDKGKVYINEIIDSSSYDIYGLDSLSNLVYEFSGSVESNEKLSGIRVTSENEHLIYGLHYFELSNQAFYRNVLTGEENVYPKENVEIFDFGLDYMSADTLYDWFADTLVHAYTAKGSLTVNNDGNADIYALNAYSNLFRQLNGWFAYQAISVRLNSIIPSMEQVRIEQGFIAPTYYEELENLKIELTGANYKFLENGPIILSPELLSSISQNPDISQLEIYPNPAINEIQIDLQEANVVQIMNSQGNILLTRKLQGGINSIDVSKLGSGLYYVLTKEKNGNLSAGKFVK